MPAEDLKVHSHSWDNLASNYAQEVISPLLHSDRCPLWELLKKIPHKGQKSIVDIGCGRGTLIPYLAKDFKSIYAFDYSAQMVVEAKNEIKKLEEKYQKKILIKKDNILRPAKLNKKFDCAVSINSILFPSPKELEKAFETIFSLLKNNGHFLGVFPALESIQEQYQETFKQELKTKKTVKNARRYTSRKFREEDIDFALGLYDTEDMIQKYYTQYELEKLLKQHGLKPVQFGQVIYQKGHSYNYETTTKTSLPPMWDWFIHAKKNK